MTGTGERNDLGNVQPQSWTDALLEERGRERLREDWPFQMPIPWDVFDRADDSRSRRIMLDLLLLLADIGQERSRPTDQTEG